MRKRDVLRRIPYFGRLARQLDALEARVVQLERENHVLAGYLRELAFSEVAARVETRLPSDLPAGSRDLPLPPAALRYLVAGKDDPAWFLQTGRLGAQSVHDALNRQQIAFRQLRNVLDFGCGCGRVLRHFQGEAGTALHGTDCNDLAVRWCSKNLPFASFRWNSMEPPTSYPDHRFDFIYAFSVFTHLSEHLQTAWMHELGRILARGGLLLISVHGEKYRDTLPPPDREQYEDGQLVVKHTDRAGSNECTAFHPESYVRKTLARGFDVVDFIPGGALGNPVQDVFTLRSPS